MTLSSSLAEIKPLSPDRLVNYYSNQQMRNSYANFGIIPYGTTLVGRVFYFENYTNGCYPFSDIILDPEGDPDNEFTPIVLVDRGNCSFVRKSRNIQDLGGALSLIADSRDNEDPENIIMIDDGTGISIVIPTIFISKEDGKKLKEIIEETRKNNLENSQHKEYVVLIIHFEMDNPDDRVEYDIWYTSGDLKALNFIRDMHSYNKRLDTNALMTPHMIVLTCPWCSTSELEENCLVIHGKAFCAPPVEAGSLKGKEILRQGLQDICVYQAYKDSNDPKEQEKWWNYMDNAYQCQAVRYSAECVSAAMQNASVDEDKVQICLRREDRILNSEHSLMQFAGIIYSPAVAINNKVYRGTVDANNVFKAICAGFNVTPSVCFDGRIQRGLSVWSIVWIILLIIGLSVVILCCYKKYERREMKEKIEFEIAAALDQYRIIKDSDTKEANIP